MYSLLNQNVKELLAFIDFNKDIEPYLLLRQAIERVDVSIDESFKRLYSDFWRMSGVFVGEEFRCAYFDYMQACKFSGTPEVEAAAEHLFRIPTRDDGSHSLQFSFATKLVHMLNPEKPIYDSFIADIYFMPSPSAGINGLRELVLSYRFLVAEYARVATVGILKPAIQALRGRFSLDATFTETKAIDTLLWGFGKFLRSGAVRSGVVVYA